MAEITAREEVCALIDTAGAFDPATAAHAGVRLDRLLWIRCAGDAERALKVADLVIQAGGFGLVIFDLGDTPLRSARRISLTSWFRLRRAVENTPTAIVVIAPGAAGQNLRLAGAGNAPRRRPTGPANSCAASKPARAASKPLGEMRYVRLHSRLG